MKVAIRRLPNADGLPSPAYASEGAAGIDLHAALAPGQKLVLEPGARDLIPTGLSIALPRGYEGQVRPRSGLAAEHAVTVLNAPGAVDSDYRGEIKVILINLGAQAFEIVRGLRIAQLVIAPAPHVTLVEVDDLDATERGAGGFGSTGLGGEGAR